MGFGYALLMYGPEEVADAVSDIAACRYEGIEIGLPKVQHMGPDRFRASVNEYGLDTYCVMAGWLISEEEVAEAVEGASIAADLGAEFLGILPPPRGQVSDEDVHEWLTEIGEAAAAAGVTPVLHHHGGAHIEQPDEIQKWLDKGPDNLRLLFDTAHYYPYGDIVEGIERFADEIAYVHLKDVNPPDDFETHVENLSAGKVDYDSIVTFLHSFTDLGKGVIDFDGVYESLADIGYDGNITAEIDNQREHQLVHAKQNYDYWTNILNQQS